MRNQEQNTTDSMIDTVKSDQTIENLQDQLAHSQAIIEQQKQQYKQLKEKMILQEQLNNQLSNFHLKTYFQDKETQTLSTQKEAELNKAREHIMILGSMLLKNKKTIQKLKKSQIKDDALCIQIEELTKEKTFLWDIVLQVHQSLTQQPLLDCDCKEDKAKELITLTQNRVKKFKR